MRAFKFDPREIEVRPISEVIGARLKNPELRAKMTPHMDKDGNLSAAVVDDSDNVGIGVGTWDPGQWVSKPIPVFFDEVLVVVSGEMCAVIDGERITAKAGEILYVPAGNLVDFGSDQGARIVWITSPPSWVALDAAYEAGKI